MEGGGKLLANCETVEDMFNVLTELLQLAKLYREADAAMYFEAQDEYLWEEINRICKEFDINSEEIPQILGQIVTPNIEP